MASCRWLAWAVASSVLTLTNASLAFRTGQDLPELASTAPVRFATDEVRLELFAKVPPSISIDEVGRAILLATEAWQAPACTSFRVNFDGSSQIAAAPADGINTVQWIDDWEERGFDPDGAGLTDVQYVSRGDGSWQIMEADIYLNASFSWRTHGQGADGERDVRAVITHELGHLAGLLHPCELLKRDGVLECGEGTDATLSALYPIYAATQVALSEDDREGICYLYPSSPCTGSSCPLEEEPSVGGASGVGVHGGPCGESSCLGETCDTDVDCAESEQCVSGQCAGGPLALGDPCDAARDCIDGVCFEGACAASCGNVARCPSDASCESQSGICTDQLAAMGSKCNVPGDCRGKKCLTTDGADARCTRSCEPGEPPCPSGWACRRVGADAEQVCTPSLRRDEEGCSIAATPAYGPRLMVVVLTLLLAALFGMRRMKKNALSLSRGNPT